MSNENVDGVSVCMKQTGWFKRLVSLALLAAMVLTLVPASAETAEEARIGYIVIHNTTTNRVVNFRPKPGSTDYLDQLPEYRVVEILEDTTYNKTAWYKAKPWGSARVGYIMAEFVQIMNESERAQWDLTKADSYRPDASVIAVTPTPTAAAAAPAATSVPASSAAQTGFLRTTRAVTPLNAPNGTRITYNNGADSLSDIPAGLVLRYYSYDGTWAQVYFAGTAPSSYAAYIKNDSFEFTDASGSPVAVSPTAVIAPAVTNAPAATAAPASAALGYIRTVLDKVNLRQTPGGVILNENSQIPLGTVLAYYSITQFDEYDWAQVNYDGKTGYVRSDCYQLSDAAGNLLSAATAVPSVVINDYGTYGQVTADNVFFRKSMNMNGDFWARLPKDWVLEVLGSETVGNILWYKVRGGIPTNPGRTYTGYIHGNFFKIIQTAASATATPVPAGSDSPYALITLSGVNLRQTPGGTPLTALEANTVVNIIGKPAGNTADDWYNIESNGVYGFVPATALRVLSTAELGGYTLPSAPSGVPGQTAAPAVSAGGYVKTVLRSVNIRKTPGGTVLTPKDRDKIPLGAVMAYTEGPVAADNYNWVKVTYNGITGYVRSDCWVYCDASGNQAAAPTATPAPTGAAATAAPTAGPGGNAVLGYIKLIKGGVNVRSNPWKTSLGQLDRDTVLPYYGTAYYNGSELWYQVYSSQLGGYGYVLGSMAQVVTDQSAATPAPTIVPGPAVSTGYIATTASSVWLRLKAEVNAATAGQVKQKGTVLALTGDPVVNGNYTWYPVTTADGTRAYLRGDFVYQLADWQVDAYKQTGTVPTPTPGPATPRPGNSNYIAVTADKVWVREKASTKAGTLGQVNTGAVLPFTTTVKSGASTWYKVTYGGKTAYILGNYARVLTNAEYDALRGTATPVPVTTPISATTAPNTTDLSDVAVTLIDKVIIRKEGSMSGRELTTVSKAGTKLTYLGKYTTPSSSNPYYWYNIQYGNIAGWMRGDLVKVLTTEEKKLYELTNDPNAPKEASYRTLSKNDTGSDVTALQQKLVEKGFLAADQVSGTYLTSTENAVIAFQKANGLTVDGIAGEKTQHALFGTVPVGTYDGSSVEATLYPVEKIDWYTGGIQNIFGVGMVAVVTDVYTGISFKAQRLYGDNHADCEPLTTADTAAICQIYGVSNAQEISDRDQELQSWRRRPLWVTIGGRTFAASMYGIPHNFKGDRIPDNNYNGQFCIHFVNSKTHGDSSNPAHVDTDAAYNGYFGHQSAIEYAYTHSISGTK